MTKIVCRFKLTLLDLRIPDIFPFKTLNAYSLNLVSGFSIAMTGCRTSDFLRKVDILTLLVDPLRHFTPNVYLSSPSSFSIHSPRNLYDFYSTI